MNDKRKEMNKPHLRVSKGPNAIKKTSKSATQASDPKCMPSLSGKLDHTTAKIKNAIVKEISVTLTKSCADHTNECSTAPDLRNDLPDEQFAPSPKISAPDVNAPSLSANKKPHGSNSSDAHNEDNLSLSAPVLATDSMNRSVDVKEPQIEKAPAKALNHTNTKTPTLMEANASGTRGSAASLLLNAPNAAKATAPGAESSDLSSKGKPFRLLKRMVPPPENETLEEAILRRQKRFGLPLDLGGRGSGPGGKHSSVEASNTKGAFYRSMADEKRERGGSSRVVYAKEKRFDKRGSRGFRSKGIEKPNHKGMEKEKVTTAAKAALEERNIERSKNHQRCAQYRNFKGNRRSDGGTAGEMRRRDRNATFPKEQQNSRAFRRSNVKTYHNENQRKQGQGRSFSYSQTPSRSNGGNFRQRNTWRAKRSAEETGCGYSSQERKRTHSADNKNCSEARRRHTEKVSKEMPRLER